MPKEWDPEIAMRIDEKESDGSPSAIKQSPKSTPSRWRAHKSQRAKSQNAHQNAVLQYKFQNSLRRPKEHLSARKKIASLKISAKSPQKSSSPKTPTTESKCGFSTPKTTALGDQKKGRSGKRSEKNRGKSHEPEDNEPAFFHRAKP